MYGTSLLARWLDRDTIGFHIEDCFSVSSCKRYWDNVPMLIFFLFQSIKALV